MVWVVAGLDHRGGVAGGGGGGSARMEEERKRVKRESGRGENEWERSERRGGVGIYIPGFISRF